MKRIVILFAFIALFCSQVINAQLRRPISTEQPMWIIHVDTWNTADPEQGRKVTAPTRRGIYINNGKKVFVK